MAGAAAKGPSKLMKVLPHLALVWVQCAYGLWNVLGRDVFERGPIFKPLAFALGRQGLSTAVFVALAMSIDGWRLPRRRDAGVFFSLGMCGVFVAQVLYVYGLRYTTATNAAVLQPFVPVLATIIGLIFQMEDYGSGTALRRRLIGVALAATGALVIVLGFGRTASHLSLRSSKHMLGNMCLFAETVGFAVYYLLLIMAVRREVERRSRRRRRPRVRVMQFVTPLLLNTMLLLFVLLLCMRLEGPTQRPSLAQVLAPIYAGVLWAVLVAPDAEMPNE